MVVQHNLTAMNSNRMLGLTTKSQAKSTEKLSSGYKINRAADDAAGLAISEKMRKQVRGLTQASTNAQDGISAVQTAEGALTEVHDMLQRMNELAVKSANGTNSEDDRSYIQSEINALIDEIDRVSETTKFNEIYLLKGDEDAGTKDVYSYKKVTTPASATIKDGVTLYDATGAQVADADALKTALEADKNAKFFTTQPTEAVKNTDYTETAAYALVDGTDVFDKDGNKLTATTLKGAAEGDGVFTEALVKGVAGDLDTSGGTGNYAITKVLYDLDGTRHGIGAVADTFDPTQCYTKDPTTVTATEGTEYTKTSTYEIAADKEVYDADGNKLDNAGLTAALGAGKKVYQDAATPAGADDYTYTPETTEKAQLYNKDGKAVAAADIEDGAELYTDKAGKDKVTDLTKYTNKDTVNEDLVFSLHVGADSTDNNKIEVTIASMSAAGIGVKGLDVSSEDTATAAIDTISEALKQVSKQRSDLGAIQNRLEHTINNLDNVVENTTSAESLIRDTDMATEMVKYANNNILAQAGQAMLAQANQANQGVLSLLG
ncbi:MAG: flagellar hook protein [Lachnospiraceae bacterium]|nr:flagellar hook protein [Lachnospiraceae bacterium]MCM1237972.1 flagellar hook protein [Lachnospiraceae bacterium]